MRFDLTKSRVSGSVRTHIVLVVGGNRRNITLELSATIVDVLVKKSGSPESHVAVVLFLFLIFFALLNLSYLRLDIRVRGHGERPPSTDLSSVPGFFLLLLFVVRTLTILLGKTTTNTFRFATLSVSDLQGKAAWTVKKPNDIIVIY